MADGGDKPNPDTGKPKPSITGTRVNGRTIAAATPIKPGDLVEAGPWQFEISSGDKTGEAVVDAGAAGGGVLLMGAAALWWRRRRSGP